MLVTGDIGNWICIEPQQIEGPRIGFKSVHIGKMLREKYRVIADIGADIEDLEPKVRSLLADKKKANRELGARLLQPLPTSKARTSIANAFLATEKTASVRALLEQIAQEAA